MLKKKWLISYRIIQMYTLREESGTLSTEISDINKVSQYLMYVYQLIGSCPTLGIISTVLRTFCKHYNG